ncbi:HupE/UreJ family protein [Phenylobacterium sp.]|uniref:HupE/UreJ family protein n=1 Tax=Phenylobacterium sp. TaxID=1871053 RepID=UPI003D265848
MRRLLPALLALTATPALAHEGHHETLTLAEQARHLLTQPDHILALAGLVVLAVAGAWQWRRAQARARK